MESMTILHEVSMHVCALMYVGANGCALSAVSTYTLWSITLNSVSLSTSKPEVVASESSILRSLPAMV